jgi:phospholipid/cholesterol/gamma-HCH transport system permease protein
VTSAADRIAAPFAAIGIVTIRLFVVVGRVALFAWQTVVRAVQPPYYPLRLLEQLVQIGWYSLPVVGMTAVFTGAALAQQIYVGGSRFNAQSTVPAIVVIGIVRELGPVLVGLMMAGRVSSAMAAEIGTMRVTEQIDALTSMGANPIHYLVVPRFLGCLLMIPSLTIMAIFMGVVGGWLYSVNVFGIDSYHYWHNSQQFVHNWDLFYGIFKSVFFGATIAIVSCYRGFNCAPGAEGVGRAATAAFVLSFVIILVLDFFLSIGLDKVHDIIWPDMMRR